MGTLQAVALIPAFIAGSNRLRGRRDATVDAFPFGGMALAFWEQPSTQRNTKV
jgi:hypothetical protein